MTSRAMPGHFDFMQHAYVGASYMMEVADLNHDDRPDVYVVDDGSDSFLLNVETDPQNHAVFEEIDVAAGVDDSFSGNTVIHDLDQDGYQDVLVAAWDQSVE